MTCNCEPDYICSPECEQQNVEEAERYRPASVPFSAIDVFGELGFKRVQG
jgi:putative lipase involved disintegration of autophagic bodies